LEIVQLTRQSIHCVSANGRVAAWFSGTADSSTGSVESSLIGNARAWDARRAARLPV
jgi:hypothetical protein